MGTLAKVLAGSHIHTSEDRYWADVEGDIEDVNGVLKVTQIRVHYTLKVPPGRTADANQAVASYITQCPAAQSVIGCIDIQDSATIAELP